MPDIAGNRGTPTSSRRLVTAIKRLAHGNQTSGAGETQLLALAGPRPTSRGADLRFASVSAPAPAPHRQRDYHPMVEERPCLARHLGPGPRISGAPAGKDRARRARLDQIRPMRQPDLVPRRLRVAFALRRFPWRISLSYRRIVPDEPPQKNQLVVLGRSSGRGDAAQRSRDCRLSRKDAHESPGMPLVLGRRRPESDGVAPSTIPSPAQTQGNTNF